MGQTPGIPTRPRSEDLPIFDGTPFWVELTAVLHPGQSSTSASVLYWDGDSWEVDANATVDAHDTFYRNFALSGERLRVAYDAESKRFEVQGSFGLLRKAKPDANIDVSVSTSGTFSIYDGTSDSTVNVTAYVEWADGDEDVSAGKECWIAYDSKAQKWYWAGGECE